MKQAWLLVAAVLLLVAVSQGQPTGWRPAAGVGQGQHRQELLSGRPFKVELEGKGIGLDIVWWPPASGIDFEHALLVSVVTSTASSSSTSPSSVETTTATATTTTKTVYVPPPRVLEREGRLLPNWRNWTWLALDDLIPAGRGHNFTVDVSVVDETSSANNETIVRRAWSVASDHLGVTYLQLRVNNFTVSTNEAKSVLDLVINDVTYGCRCHWRALANANQSTTATATAQMFNSELRPVKGGGPHDWECIPGEGAPVIPAGAEYQMWVYYAGRLVLPVVLDAPIRPLYAVVTTGAVAVGWTMTPTPQGEHVACPGTELAFRGAFVPDRRYRCLVFVSTPGSSPKAHVLASTEELPDAPSGSRVVCALPPAASGFPDVDGGATVIGVFLAEVQPWRIVYNAVNLTIPYRTSCTDHDNDNGGGGDSGNGGSGSGGGNGGDGGNGGGSDGGGGSDQGGNGGGSGGDDDDGGDGQGNDAPAAWDDVTRLMWMLTCAGAALLVAFGLCTAAVTFRTHTRSRRSLSPAPEATI